MHSFRHCQENDLWLRVGGEIRAADRLQPLGAWTQAGRENNAGQGPSSWLSEHQIPVNRDGHCTSGQEAKVSVGDTPASMPGM